MKIIVLGDGLYGACTAFLLRQAGVNTLLVGPRDARPVSATEVSGGLLRVVDLDFPLAQIALAGIDTFRNWQIYGFPGTCGYDGSGAVFLANDREVIEQLSVAAALGDDRYPIQRLSALSLRALFPALCLEPETVGFYEPFGGYGSPQATRHSLIAGFYQLGGEYQKLETVAVENGSIIVSSDDSRPTRIVADAVVIAAGRGSSTLLEKAGFLPNDISILTPRTIGTPYFEPQNSGSGSTIPVLVDLVNKTFYRPLPDGRFLVGAGNDGQEIGEMDSPVLSADLVDDARSRIESTVPHLKGARHIGGVVGVDVYTRTSRPIAGRLSKRPGLFLATGFSGRGYKIAPPICAALARAILLSIEAKTSDLIERIAIDEPEFASFVVAPDSAFTC